jgi:hypothetical protein
VINRAAYAEAGTVADVGINHRGRNIFVPEEFLNGPDIITVLQKMGSETVPKRMTARRFRDTAGPDGILDRVLQVSLRDVVPACLAATRINGGIVSGEDILPSPLTGCVGIFPLQGARKIDGAAVVGEVLLMKFFDPGEVRLERAAKPVGQDGNAFPHTLAFSDGDLAISKIDIFDA